MKTVICALAVLCLWGCKERPTPKDKAFFRIAFPKKEYREVEDIGLYSFALPVYATLEDALRVNVSKEEYQEIAGKEIDATKMPFASSNYDDTVNFSWQNVYFPKQNGQLHLTYFPIKRNLAEYLEDTHKFVYKHAVKADGIQMKEYAAPERNVYGALYDIEGNTASSVQFYLTDSTHHFLRGSLYLNEKPNKDSLNVVIDFLREDVIRLMQTLEWK